VNEKKYVESVQKRIKRRQTESTVDKCIMCGKEGNMWKKVGLSLCDECIRKPKEEVEKAISEYKKVGVG
jgi:ribosomal protein S14